MDTRYTNPGPDPEADVETDWNFLGCLTHTNNGP